MEEVWKNITIFGEDFRVSTLGNLFREGRYVEYPDGHKQYIKGFTPAQQKMPNGYMCISFTDSEHVQHTAYTHIFVAKAFCDNDNKYTEVHHIDGNKLNNSYTNLMWVTHKFNMIEMFKFYNSGQEHFIKYCIDCHKEINFKATRCRDCSIKHRSGSIGVKSNININDTHKLLIENNGNFSKVARMYNISPNALVKRCKRMNIPHKSRDYKR